MAFPIVAIDQQAWMKVESAFDTLVAFSAGDAVQVLELEITPNLEFHKSREYTGSATLQTEIEGKRGGTWRMRLYARTAALGSAPNFGPLLRAANTAQTLTSSTSASYALKESGTPDSLQIGRKVTADFYEQINGAWVEQFDVEYVGNQEPVITASGGFASYSYLYQADVDGSHSAADTTIALQAADAHKVRGKLYLAFGSDNNSGSGYSLSSVSADGLTLTIAGGLATGAADGDDVTVVLPAWTPASTTLLGGIDCGLSVGGTAVGVISSKTSYKTGVQGLSTEAAANRANRLVRGPREVTVEATCYVLDENTGFAGGAWVGTTRSVVQRLGSDTAAQRVKITTPALRFDVTAPDLPEAEAATFTLRGVARKSSANGDELSILCD